MQTYIKKHRVKCVVLLYYLQWVQEITSYFYQNTNFQWFSKTWTISCSPTGGWNIDFEKKTSIIYSVDFSFYRSLQ